MVGWLFSKIETVYLKSAWEEDLGLVVTDEQWDEAYWEAHKASVWIRRGLTLLWLFVVKLGNMYFIVESISDRCKLAPVWRSVFQTLDSSVQVTQPD